MILLNVITIALASLKAFLITFILFIIFWMFYVIFIVLNRRRYAHIPSPDYNHFILGHALELNKLYNQVYLADWVKNHGSIFCIYVFHKVLLIVTKPDLVKEILTNPIYTKDLRFYKYYKKLAGVNFMGNSLLTNLNDEDYHFKRRHLAPFFTEPSLRKRLPILNKVTNDLMELLKGCSDSNPTVKILHVMQACTIDMLWQTAFSKKFSAIDRSNSVTLFQTMKIIFKFLIKLWNNPLYEKMPWNYKEFMEVRSNLSDLRCTVRDMLLERVAAVTNNEDTPDDLLDSIVRHLSPHCSTEELVDELILIITTVTENIASVVCFCLLELGRNPSYISSLQNEIDSIIFNKSDINSEDLKHMKLLNSCLQETLRLYPPIPHTCRISPDNDDCQLGILSLPSNTSILVSILGIHYTQHKNAFDFVPERYINPKTSNNFIAESYAFIPFSSGLRSCVGQNYALLSAKLLLAKFLQHFEYELDPYETFALAESVRLKPANRCKIFIKPRNR